MLCRRFFIYYERGKNSIKLNKKIVEKNFEKKILFFLESRIVERENRNREDGIKGGWIKMFHLGNSIRKRFWIYRGVHIMTSFYLSENRPLKPSWSNYWQEFRWVSFFSEYLKSFESKVITQKFYLWSLVLELHYSHFKL